MRIGLVCPEPPPSPGNAASGIASYTFQCARALADAGQDVHLFLPAATAPDHPLAANIAIHPISPLPDRLATNAIHPAAASLIANAAIPGELLSNSVYLAHALHEAHRRTPLDLVEVPEVFAAGLALQFGTPIQPPFPVVTMLHTGTAISRHYNDLTPSPDDTLQIAMEFASLLLADALCAPTHAVVAETRRHLPFNLPVDVFPSPVRLPNHSPESAINPAGAYAFYAGRLETLKGCPELAIAAATFLTTCPDAELHLAGQDVPLPDGSSTRAWMSAQLPPHLLPRMKFLGPLSPDQMLRAYQNARFIVVPSRFENFGTVSQEALAAHRPVLYAAGHGLDETVGDAGLPVPRRNPVALAAAMTRLWNDAHLRESLIRRTIERRSHSNDTAITQRFAFYRKVANAPLQPLAEKRRRLSLLPPAHLHALLNALTSLISRSCGFSSAWQQSPAIRARHALLQHQQSGHCIDRLYLYGAGKHTRRLLAERHRIESLGAQILGILDDAASPDQRLANLPVLLPATALPRLADHALVLLSSDSIEPQLWANAKPLRTAGIPVLPLYHDRSTLAQRDIACG